MLAEVVDRLQQDSRVRYYMTNQQQVDAITKRFSQLVLKLFKQNDIELEMSIRYVVSIGGDGTVLYAAKLFQNRSTPKIIAVEKGTLGFLCKFRIEQIDHALDTLLATRTGKTENLNA